MKRLLLAALIGLPLAGCLEGCRSNPSTGQLEPDWPVIAKSLEVAAGELLDEAMAAEPSNPQLAETLLVIATAAEQASVFVKAGPPDSEGLVALAALKTALDPIYERMAAEEEATALRAAVRGVRSILRVILAFSTPLPP